MVNGSRRRTVPNITVMWRNAAVTRRSHGAGTFLAIEAFNSRSKERWGKTMCPAEERNVETEAEPGPAILLVEDETLLRISAAEHLRDAGFIVFEAVNGAEAQAILEAGVNVDLIFSDINMPVLDGVALAAWLSTLENAPPMLLTSGVAAVLDSARATCPGVKGFLAKPYPYGEMELQIRAALPKIDV
jgi:CheY-like chemotaxis protein